MPDGGHRSRRAAAARRPYVFAWNFVVLGLVAVMLLPLAEQAVIGTSPIDPLRIFFVSATLAVGLLNYLPTRAAPAVLLMALAVVGELLGVFAPGAFSDRGEVQLFHLLVLLSPWAAWICWRARRGAFGVRRAVARLPRSARSVVGTSRARTIQPRGTACRLAGAPCMARAAPHEP